MEDEDQEEVVVKAVKELKCYVPVSQVNPVSVSVRPVTFPQM